MPVRLYVRYGPGIALYRTVVCLPPGHVRRVLWIPGITL
jgi:hypothetical protein